MQVPASIPYGILGPSVYILSGYLTLPQKILHLSPHEIILRKPLILCKKHEFHFFVF